MQRDIAATAPLGRLFKYEISDEMYIYTLKFLCFSLRGNEYLEYLYGFWKYQLRNRAGYKGACIYLETERRGKDKKWTTLDINNNSWYKVSKFSILIEECKKFWY